MVSVSALSAMADSDNSAIKLSPLSHSDDQDNVKRRKVDENSNVSGVWLTVHNIQLKISEKTISFDKEELNDRIINAHPHPGTQYTVLTCILVQSFYGKKGVSLKLIAAQTFSTVSSTKKNAL